MSMTLIEHIEVGSGGAASIEFTSIPATYTDLILYFSLRDGGTTDPVTRVQFNSDTGSNYSYRLLFGTGSSASYFTQTTTSLFAGNHPNSGYTADTFGNGSLYIPNYTQSSVKSASIDEVAENNATTSWQQISANLWNDTSSITSIKIYPVTSSWVQYSSATLYGITAGSSGGVTVS